MSDTKDRLYYNAIYKRLPPFRSERKTAFFYTPMINPKGLPVTGALLPYSHLQRKVAHSVS